MQGIVTSSFGARLDPFNGEGAFHTGIDIATSKGDAVRAPADGTVIKAGMGNGYGREVVVDHGHGVETLYAHLSGFAVIAGQDVRRGDILGYVGSSGHSTGPHLHYEVRIHDTPVNPSKYLHAAPARQLASTPSAPSALPTPAAQTKTRFSLLWFCMAACAWHPPLGHRSGRDNYFGFDKNDYPGDNLLPATAPQLFLHRLLAEQSARRKQQ